MFDLQEWSRALGDAVQTAEKSLVTVFGGRGDGATGVAWASDLVVTAAHAIERNDSVEIAAALGRVPATVLGVDPASDVAVLRAEGAFQPPAHSDPAKLRIGEVVVALSRPGRGLRARFGIVSRVGGPFRLAGGQEVERYLESDIVPGPGHSGSLLFDVSGGLVGHNNAGIARGALVALPRSAVARVVDSIVAHGRVRRARLGVGLERVELPRAVAERRGQSRGLLVISVLEGSPADRGGVVLGDVILTASGRATERVDELMNSLGEGAIDAPLPVDILRAGQEKTLELVPEAR
jgi:S1-C subfamily serine protease